MKKLGLYCVAKEAQLTPFFCPSRAEGHARRRKGRTIADPAPKHRCEKRLRWCYALLNLFLLTMTSPNRPEPKRSALGGIGTAEV